MLHPSHPAGIRHGQKVVRAWTLQLVGLSWISSCIIMRPTMNCMVIFIFCQRTSSWKFLSPSLLEVERTDIWLKQPAHRRCTKVCRCEHCCPIIGWHQHRYDRRVAQVFDTDPPAGPGRGGHEYKGSLIRTRAKRRHWTFSLPLTTVPPC